MASRRRRSAALKLEPPPAPVPEAASGLNLVELVTVIVACLLIAWRAQAYPINQFWHDWVVIVSAYAVFSALAGRTKAWAPVTIAAMGLLLFIFTGGNLPKVLSMFEWLP